jgi:hypothetical protein
MGSLGRSNELTNSAPNGPAPFVADRAIMTTATTKVNRSRRYVPPRGEHGTPPPRSSANGRNSTPPGARSRGEAAGSSHDTDVEILPGVGRTARRSGARRAVGALDEMGRALAAAGLVPPSWPSARSHGR